MSDKEREGMRCLKACGIGYTFGPTGYIYCVLPAGHLGPHKFIKKLWRNE